MREISAKLFLDKEIELYSEDAKAYILGNSISRLAIALLLAEGKVSAPEWVKAVIKAKEMMDKFNDELEKERQNPIC